jgi:ABC transport system ATP-binding/permease protein
LSCLTIRLPRSRWARISDTAPSNVLVLDEPTNDLDLETLDVLEEMIGDYAGTVLLITHDRDFLDRIVDGVIVGRRQSRGWQSKRSQRDCWNFRGENDISD